MFVVQPRVLLFFMVSGPCGRRATHARRCAWRPPHRSEHRVQRAFITGLDRCRDWAPPAAAVGTTVAGLVVSGVAGYFLLFSGGSR